MTESMTRTVVASLVLSASLVACGQSGSGAADEPVPSITGRWALVGWVDPVGVELRQAAAGSLTGGGCAYGAPPLQGVAKCDRVYPAEFYGAISGAIAGAQAKFGFQFGLGEYSADVTVSADGKRMGGLFSTSTGDVLFPTAWLPVTDGDAAPATSSLPSASADYELRLSAADSGATEYVPGQVYDLYYRLVLVGRVLQAHVQFDDAAGWGVLECVRH